MTTFLKSMFRSAWAAVTVAGVLSAGRAFAADAPAAVPTPLKVDTGDTAWMLTASALVLLMTPGLAFFYGGLVRRKNILSLLMQCFMLMGVVTLQWVAFGYSLAFGPTHGGWIGGLDWAWLKGVGLDPNTDYGATVPHQAFMIFQMMFAIITPALIAGAFAERMKFSAFCVFTLLWATFVYDPVCHWVWAVGGMIRTTGALDFAGGTVVHINAGIAALVTALMLGKRIGYPDRISPPHNLPMAVLGAGLLWFGWFGFNAGSAIGSGQLSTSAFVVTHIAAAVAGLTWAALDWMIAGKPTVLGIITGAVAGLVAITPASGFVDPLGAIVIGIGVSLVCYFSLAVVKRTFGYDDSLDAFGVHGVGGFFGAVATGFLATKAVNAAGADGLFHGNPGLVWIQLKAALVTVVYSGVVSWVLLKIVDVTIGLRVSDQEERIGLDLTQHREAGYTSLE